MLWFDVEIEGEEWPQDFIATYANESPKGHQEDHQQIRADMIPNKVTSVTER